MWLRSNCRLHDNWVLGSNCPPFVQIEGGRALDLAVLLPSCLRLVELLLLIGLQKASGGMEVRPGLWHTAQPGRRHSAAFYPQSRGSWSCRNTRSSHWARRRPTILQSAWGQRLPARRGHQCRSTHFPALRALLPSLPSSTSCTFSISAAGVKGFCKNATSCCSTPLCSSALPV
jgi:hypothetical protein